MTSPLLGTKLSQSIKERFPEAVVEVQENAVVLQGESLLEVARFLNRNLALDYLVAITAVDYLDYLEVIYQLTSIKDNQSVILKTRCHDRDNPVLPSVTSIWQGADLQEREVYDLMGIGFLGHPNLKRILLWEGFEGHPLRKDYL